MSWGLKEETKEQKKLRTLRYTPRKNSATSSLNTPFSSIGQGGIWFIATIPSLMAMRWSSSPNAGAWWTIPVPESEVTYLSATTRNPRSAYCAKRFCQWPWKTPDSWVWDLPGQSSNQTKAHISNLPNFCRDSVQGFHTSLPEVLSWDPCKESRGGCHMWWRKRSWLNRESWGRWNLGEHKLRGWQEESMALLSMQAEKRKDQRQEGRRQSL